MLSVDSNSFNESAPRPNNKGPPKGGPSWNYVTNLLVRHGEDVFPYWIVELRIFHFVLSEESPLRHLQPLSEFKRNENAVNLFEFFVLGAEGVTVIRNQKRHDAPGRSVEVKIGGIPF